jgi:hypothetical protein
MEDIQQHYVELSVKEYEKKIKNAFLLKLLVHGKLLVKTADYILNFNRMDLEDYIVS